MTKEDCKVRESPGNALYPEVPSMKAPSLEFVYRLVAKMHPTDGYDISNVMGTGVSRSIGHVQSGTAKGPGIEGIVMENSGATGPSKSTRKRRNHIFVQARGLFRPGPGVTFDFEESMDASYSQDQVEYFTHITFEAAGNGPYNWMNGIVAIGALQSYGDAAIIDCWRLTNFPGQKVEDVYVGR